MPNLVHDPLFIQQKKLQEECPPLPDESKAPNMEETINAVHEKCPEILGVVMRDLLIIDMHIGYLRRKARSLGVEI